MRFTFPTRPGRTVPARVPGVPAPLGRGTEVTSTVLRQGQAWALAAQLPHTPQDTSPVFTGSSLFLKTT